MAIRTVYGVDPRRFNAAGPPMPGPTPTPGPSPMPGAPASAQPTSGISGMMANNPAQWDAIASALIGGKNPNTGGFNFSQVPGASQFDQAQAAAGADRAQKVAAVKAWIDSENAAGRVIPPGTAKFMIAAPEWAMKMAADQMTPQEPKMEKDSNGILKYTTGPDKGVPVFGPTDKPSGEGMFAGKSVSGQGLNWLVGHGNLTEEQAAQVAAGKVITGADGSQYYMKPEDLASVPGAAVAPPGDPGAPAPGGPGGKQLTGPKTFGTDEQTKAAGFATRADTSDQILSDPKVIEAGSNLTEQGKSAIPVLGNYIVSNDYQKYDQAARNFINATLRRESGAVISPEEFKNAREQYLPQPGDGEDKLKLKSENRKQVVEALKRSAGPLNKDFVNGGGATSAPAPGEVVKAEDYFNQ